MKIGIITQPLRYNYGGILQNFALQTVLKRMGHECVTLDDPILPNYPWYKWLVKFCNRIYLRYYKGVNSELFSEFRKAREYSSLGRYTSQFINMHISRKTLNDALNNEDFDALIVGSDQVWRPCMNTANFGKCFLDFAKDWTNIKRIAYAASFGSDKWEYSKRETLYYKELVGKFDAISVREKSGIELCKKGFEVDATFVLDPTLLLSKQDYISLCNLGKIPDSKGDLLCYILDDNPKIDELVISISKVNGYKAFNVNSKVEDRSANMNERIHQPVEEWLRGFMDAKFVITDSFHACVFSMIFNKPFIVVGNKERGMARYHSLLSLFGQEFRLISSVDSFVVQEAKYYQTPDVKLAQLQNGSMNFLKKALSL